MKSIILTPTPNLDKSIAFYKKLRYYIKTGSDKTLVSDGKIIIEINDSRTARSGIVFYKDSWSIEIAELNKLGKVVEKENQYVTIDPNGVHIYLRPISDYQDCEIPDGINAIPGNFAGISIECMDFGKSVEFWKIFGYKITMGGEDSGWASMANDTDIGVALMKYGSCPHLFFNPSFTYFNGSNNLNIIEEIRKAGIQLTEEITVFNDQGIVDNIIIRDPGGFGYFLFSD